MYIHLKHTLDTIFASLILTLLFLPLLLIAAWIKLDSRGPVLFKQQRYGKDKKVFTMYKFRTMKTIAPIDCPTNDLLNAKELITRPGRLLRKLSIDEIPQLINVIKGDMSIIGPRPVVLKERALITHRQKYGANSCRPGITGWAQINGRDKIGNREKARLDGEYVQSIGMRMDLRCFIGTVQTIATGKGYAEGRCQTLSRLLTPDSNNSLLQDDIDEYNVAEKTL